MTIQQHEDMENLQIELGNLSRLVAQLLERERDSNGNLRAAEISLLREMIQAHRDNRRYWRNARIYTGYLAASIIFFYTIREYVALLWTWLRAIPK